MALPKLPYNQENYPHAWRNGFCTECGVAHGRWSADSPFPCPAIVPKLNADGTVWEGTTPDEPDSSLYRALLAGSLASHLHLNAEEGNSIVMHTNEEAARRAEAIVKDWLKAADLAAPRRS